MTIKQFRISIMIIVLVALIEVVVGVFYYFVLLKPKNDLQTVVVKEESDLQAKKLEQERILEETRLREQTRREEIKLEVKEIDLELARIERWEEAGEEFEAMRKAEEEKKGKESSLISCMKIVVENYHNEWNKYCSDLGLPTACSLPEENTKKINYDYEVGKKQCDDFFNIKKAE